LHICLILKINSESDLNDNNKFYILITTAYAKTEEEFTKFKQQNLKSNKHPNQIPIHIVGESIDSFIN